MFCLHLFEKIVFKACDLVWTGYTKDFYGSSGVYFLSSLNHRPVICSNHGSIGWYAKKYKIGISLDLSNKIKLVKALNKLTNIKIKDYKFDKVNSQHNFRKFGQQITEKFI